jgi:hypothetical protein
MELTEQHIRYIIKGEVNIFLTEQLSIAGAKGQVKSLNQKVKRDPHLKSSIEDAVKSIVNHSGIKKDLEKIMDNPVASATFITALMSHLGLDANSYVNILSSLSEVKRESVNIILKNCFKVLK